MLVGSERGAFVAVYRLEGGSILASSSSVDRSGAGGSPDHSVAGLFVTANEGDDADGTISIFEGVPGGWDPSADRPRIFSSGVEEAWGALSGLAASPFKPHLLYSVPDDALPSSIFSIHVGEGFARIRERTPVTRFFEQVLFNLEGIAVDTSIARPRKDAGFWLASEGNANTTRNTLIQVDGRGESLARYSCRRTSMRRAVG